MEEQAPSEKEELVHEVLGFNFRKLWITFKELSLRPGQTIAAYCDGTRSKYISPITYCLLTYGISYLFKKPDPESSNLLVNTLTNGFRSPNMTLVEVERMRSIITSTLEFTASKEVNILIAFPVVVLCQWFLFKNFRKPFLQHLYFILFVTAQINLFTTPLGIAISLTKSDFWLICLFVIELIITLIIYFYAEFKFYPRIKVGDIAIGAIGMAVGIVPFMIWYGMVCFATYFFIKTFLY